MQSVSQRMNLIVTEVQEQVMKTRMQPIGNVWNKFPRTVRDLAVNCGKEVHPRNGGARTPNSIERSSKRSKIRLRTWSATPLTMESRCLKFAGKQEKMLRDGLCGLRAFQEGGQGQYRNQRRRRRIKGRALAEESHRAWIDHAATSQANDRAGGLQLDFSSRLLDCGEGDQCFRSWSRDGRCENER